MKKFITLATVLLLLSTNAAFAAIGGGPHDFSGWSSNTNSELCVPCHTPHNADPYGTGNTAPLWNHDDSAAASWTMYDNSFSTSIDNTVAATPNGRSMACLSCHDGVSAVDNYGGASGGSLILGSAALPASNANAVFGSDLTGDHPISIEMDNTVDTALNDPTTLSLATVYGANNTVECASCHTVHGDGNGDTSAAGVGFLREDNTGSVLCLDCHNK
jgi:hypothetical protein